MKKYLMSGIAAFAFCAAFTSCSKSDLYDEGQINQNAIEKAQQDYAAAFIATFGQPAANQDWGFGSRSFTRANYDADHPGAYPNANMWADDGWKAPTELTAGQRLRVRAYFQANPNLTYVDPEYTDFFVQQVYKGGVAAGAISAEVYYTTNGEPQTGSDNMDHLTFGIENGKAKDHVFNYNHGRYSTQNTSDPEDLGAPRNNVQNYPGVTYHNNNADGKTHQDQIMLMTGSSTECVGFMSSVPSMEHNDCMANASAETIDRWAEDNKEALIAAGLYGEPVTDSQWERSFVGLDYEAMPLENAYVTPRTAAKALDFATGGYAYILYNKTIYKIGELADFDLKDKYNNPVYYVIDNVSNMAVGKRMKYTKDGQETDITKDYCNYNMSKAELENTYHVTGVGHSQEHVYDLDKIIELAKNNCLPTQNNGNWVKDLGGRDYVFSDWIITLTKASQVEIERYDIRVIAEDLNANADDDARTDEDSDWDFNDVVFDIKFLNPAIVVDGETVNVKICVVAAGGTYPLYIENQEVHALFGQDTKTMINTEASAYGKAYQTPVGQELPVFYLYSADAASTNGKSIKVTVDKGNGPIELTAEVGLPAAKLGVSPNFNYCMERVDITGQYPLFIQWVRTATPQVWWNSSITGN